MPIETKNADHARGYKQACDETIEWIRAHVKHMKDAVPSDNPALAIYLMGLARVEILLLTQSALGGIDVTVTRGLN